MKKLFLLILLAVPVTAFSQVKVVSETAPVTTIAKLYTDLSDTHHSIVEVQTSDDIGFVLSAATTNRFDGRFLFHLGMDGEGAVQTLLDLAALCDTQESGSTIILESGPGETCRCSILDWAGKDIGKPAMIVFGADGYAGIVMMKPKHLRQLADKTKRYIGK